MKKNFSRKIQKVKVKRNLRENSFVRETKFLRLNPQETAQTPLKKKNMLSMKNSAK